MNRSLALWRWAGVGVIWDAADPEPAPLRAVAETVAPQVNLTVVHVQAGGLVNFGVLGPRLIPAAPQQRAAVTPTPITEGEQE